MALRVYNIRGSKVIDLLLILDRILYVIQIESDLNGKLSACGKLNRIRSRP